MGIYYGLIDLLFKNLKDSTDKKFRILDKAVGNALFPFSMAVHDYILKTISTTQTVSRFM